MPLVKSLGQQPHTTSSAPQTVSTTAAKSAVARPVLANYSDFKTRPFAVVKETSDFQWTQEDGKDTNIIRRLAHNEGEYRRMVTENEEIYRRQLVYHGQSFSLLAQKAIASGERIQQLTLPEMDGQELKVTVTKTEFKNDGNKGLFYGKVPGDPGSMVTVAFVGGREAFTLISPMNQIYLLAEAREPGEIVLKSINPTTYGMMGR